MAHWNEIRTAAYVARLGTVSAAAEALDVHRATVIRHIDQLEAHFGAKLFIRAKSGYTATDFGQELMRVADQADAQFAGLRRTVSAQQDGPQGELIISTLDLLVPDLLPVIEAYVRDHPGMQVQLQTGEALTKLEIGEADIAFRVGARPDHPDHIVTPFQRKSLGLFAARRYVERHGLPFDDTAGADHIFISSSEPRHLGSAWLRWLARNIPARSIRYRFNNYEVAEQAILGGLGIGFIPHNVAKQRTDMVEVRPPLKAWSVTAWRVTHVDVHRSAKMSAFLKTLRAIHPK